MTKLDVTTDDQTNEKAQSTIETDEASRSAELREMLVERSYNGGGDCDW